jgi:hypothetical protein
LTLKPGSTRGGDSQPAKLCYMGPARRVSPPSAGVSPDNPGYEVSRRCRKRIEEAFDRIKDSAGLARIKLRGRAKVDAAFTLAFGCLQPDATKLLATRA